MLGKSKIHPQGNPSGRNSKSKILLLSLLLAMLLSACGELTPNGKSDQLLINEVLTGDNVGDIQWVELLNNSNNDVPLAGYKLQTSAGTLDLGALTAGGNLRGTIGKGRTLVFSNYPKEVSDQIYKIESDSAQALNATAPVVRRVFIEERKVLGNLRPDKDLLVLKAQDNSVVDQLGWGEIDQGTRTTLGVSSDINLNQKAPASDVKSLGRTPYLGQREPTDPGQIDPGVFTIHNTPSPGLNTTPRAPASLHPVLTTVTDIIATAGGALLWLVFFIIALVAKRFETLAEQKTYWQYLMVAPAGILIYAIIQVYNFIAFGRLPDNWTGSWPAFLALFISGVACVYVINIFRLIAKNILEAE